jgi:NAD(P)-dependent dehydrogenase (short-subunit alcohol dehydrogenase family)
MDVDPDTSVRDGIDALLAERPIDVLVNNAGVEAVGSVEEQPPSRFQAIMETNYFGVIRCIQVAVSQMRLRRTGCIINVSSVAGRFSCSPFASYCASKWALEALSEALAGDFPLRLPASPAQIRQIRCSYCYSIESDIYLRQFFLIS